MGMGAPTMTPAAGMVSPMPLGGGAPGLPIPTIRTIGHRAGPHGLSPAVAHHAPDRRRWPEDRPARHGQDRSQETMPGRRARNEIDPGSANHTCLSFLGLSQSRVELGVYKLDDTF
jgi:hypothetical protein